MKILIFLALGFLIFPLTVFGQVDETQEISLSDLQEANLELTFEYPADIEQSFSQLAAIAEDKGQVRVIVALDVPVNLEGGMEVGEIQTQKERIESVQNSLLKELSAIGELDPTVHKFSHVPYIVITVDFEALSVLQESPMIAGITQDVAEPLLLKDSTVVVGADKVWDPALTGGSFTGAGWQIGILDSGVDKNHSFFSGKVVSEACYSTNNISPNSESLCPGGVEESTAINSGLPCVGILGCDHGTHVAGIAAGDTFQYAGFTYRGVAPDAEIIAIKVFSKFNDASSCLFGAPCILSYRSDQMKGLERLIDLSQDPNFDISSVNLSLGGGRFTSPCDTDPRKPLVDQLSSLGVATVIASGNNGFDDAISTPACISSAISVGSTTKSDTVSSFSNSSPDLDILAPGSSIASSLPNNQFGSKSGTSMATPHVAGAWALMKEKQASDPSFPPFSVNDYLSVLQSTGVTITDTRNNLDFERIQVDAAIPEVPEFPITLLVFAVALIPIILLIRKQRFVGYRINNFN